MVSSLDTLISNKNRSLYKFELDFLGFQPHLLGFPTKHLPKTRSSRINKYSLLSKHHRDSRSIISLSTTGFPTLSLKIQTIIEDNFGTLQYPSNQLQTLAHVTGMPTKARAYKYQINVTQQKRPSQLVTRCWLDERKAKSVY